MKSALLLATGLLAISSTASAGGYLGLALGTQPGVNDEMAKDVGDPAGRSLRALGGIRFANNFAIEGALNGFGVVAPSRGDQTAYQVSAAARLNIPLGNNFEGFARLGLERTWVNVGDERYNWAGNGFLVGGGFAYRLEGVFANSGVLANSAVFVDYNVDHATLENTRDKRDETARIWALGFTIGL
jgi:hypothetical protein